MVDVVFTGSSLLFNVEGMDKLWALKSSLEIPIEHVCGVTADPPGVHDWWKGMRLGGTQMPRILTAGTFLYHGTRVFWDVADPQFAIGIALRDERYSELIIQVRNPYETVEMIQAAIQQSGSAS